MRPLRKVFAALDHHTTTLLQQCIEVATRKICTYTSAVLIKFSGREAMLLPRYLSITQPLTVTYFGLKFMLSFP